jgi:hypothetical protein
LGELQGPEDLAQALGRRLYADTNKSILQVLHETGHLKAVPIDKIVMTPDGNHRIPLRAVLESIGRLPTNPGRNADMPGSGRSSIRIATTRSRVRASSRSEAQNLLAEAEFLEGCAARSALRLTLGSVAEPVTPGSGCRSSFGSAKTSLRRLAISRSSDNGRRRAPNVESEAFLDAALAERARHFNLPGTESDVTKGPNDWIVTVASLLVEAKTRSGIPPTREEFFDAMTKAVAVIIASVEHVELMSSKNRLK